MKQWVKHGNGFLSVYLCCFFAAEFVEDSIIEYFVLTDVCCPYGLIFGGTDLNVYAADPCYKDIMLQAVTNARFDW